MKLTPELRSRLSGEYVLGTLAPRARARLAGMARHDGELRAAIRAWETRLAPLAELAPAVTPPARVWRAVAARIAGSTPRSGLWYRLGFWRGVAAAASVCALALAVYFGVAPQEEPRTAMVAVLSDDKANPAVVVSWPPQQSERDRQLKIKVRTHPQMAADTAWELWMIPGGKERPVSLGLVSAQPDQTIRLSAATSQVIGKAWGLAISVEPAGGSPTGQPTGPVILKGPCVKVI